MKTALVIMAAGMGSRFGGLKQLAQVGPHGEKIIDYTIFDAVRAGFDRVVFIIKEELYDTFREVVGDPASSRVKVDYIFQRLEALPAGFLVLAERRKPWGTGHAVLCCRETVQEPFAVVNADDYYGPHAFKEIYNYLSTHEDDDKYRYTMVGYILENTLTENGHVARGVCTTDENHQLVGICERTHIEKRGDVTAYTEDDGATWTTIPAGSIVSMNMWGFTSSILKEIGSRFPKFLEENLPKNPMKCEFFLPSVVGELLAEDKATVEVLKSEDKWYGVTYKEDKPVVVAAIQKLKDEGRYPQKLWED